jgi:hypothetical protein
VEKVEIRGNTRNIGEDKVLKIKFWKKRTNTKPSSLGTWEARVDTQQHTWAPPPAISLGRPFPAFLQYRLQSAGSLGTEL